MCLLPVSPQNVEILQIKQVIFSHLSYKVVKIRKIVKQPNNLETIFVHLKILCTVCDCIWNETVHLLTVEPLGGDLHSKPVFICVLWHLFLRVNYDNLVCTETKIEIYSLGQIFQIEDLV